MKTVYKYGIAFLEKGLIISISMMLIVVTIQVIARFMLPKAPAWTEEAARLCFIFSIAFGGGLGIRNHAFVRLEWFLDRFSNPARKYMHATIYLFICVLSLIITVSTIDFVGVGRSETSPTLLIPMNYIFMSIFFLFLLIALFSVERMVSSIKQSNS